MRSLRDRLSEIATCSECKIVPVQNHYEIHICETCDLIERERELEAMRKRADIDKDGLLKANTELLRVWGNGSDYDLQLAINRIAEIVNVIDVGCTHSWEPYEGIDNSPKNGLVVCGKCGAQKEGDR